jgi:putative DNA primase/helicase
MTSLRELATALGGELVKSKGIVSVLCPGPGHSARDRSLSVTPSAMAPDGFIVFSHSPRDDWRTCRDYVRGKLGRPVEYRASAAENSNTDNSARAVALWNEAFDPRGTLVERYLRCRGLELPADIAVRVVRFHANCPWGRDRAPCMLTAFRLIQSDRLIAVHRTLLSLDGKKIDRRMLGPVAGAAIKIDVDEDVELGLAVGEGFETCLAARQLGFRPVWALGSAGAIANFPILSGINALTIFAETDDTGANARAVRACGNRWAATDREVLVAMPRLGGDMNGALQS